MKRRPHRGDLKAGDAPCRGNLPVGRAEAFPRLAVGGLGHMVGDESPNPEFLVQFHSVLKPCKTQYK